MSRTLARRTATHVGRLRQAYVLIAFGIILLLLAWLLHPNPLAYPVGLLLFGVGMLIAAFLNPYRLMIGGILVTLIGIAIFFAYKPGIIPDGGNTIFFAIGLGLLGIALAAKRGYVRAGAVTPALIILLVGLREYGPTNSFLPRSLPEFILSLWFPGLALLILGVVYLLASGRAR